MKADLRRDRRSKALSRQQDHPEDKNAYNEMFRHSRVTLPRTPFENHPELEQDLVQPPCIGQQQENNPAPVSIGLLRVATVGGFCLHAPTLRNLPRGGTKHDGFQAQFKNRLSDTGDFDVVRRCTSSGCIACHRIRCDPASASFKEQGGDHHYHG